MDDRRFDELAIALVARHGTRRCVLRGLVGAALGLVRRSDAAARRNVPAGAPPPAPGRARRFPIPCADGP